MKRAFNLLEDNARKHPEFLENYKSLGLLHAIIGTVPENYKWAVSLIGLEGSIDQGVSELNKILNAEDLKGTPIHEETQIIYSFIVLYLKNDLEMAWVSVNESRAALKDNLLYYFVAANIAIRTGHNDDAIEILESRPRGAEYFPFHFLEYLLGLAKLYQLDQDAAIHFKNFIREFKGRHYIKDSYQKIAWLALLNGDSQGYIDNMNKCRVKGFDQIDPDKQALKEAKGVKVNPFLLKAR